MKNAAVALLLLSLSACGGGGGDGSGPTITPSISYDFATALANRTNSGLMAKVSVTGNVVVSGTSYPVTGSGTVTYAPATSVMFNSQAALSQNVTASLNIIVQGTSNPLTTAVTDYYATSTYNFLGETSTGQYDVPSAPLMYPATVMVGSSGNLGTLQYYTDSTASVQIGTTEVSYLVKANPASANSVIFELINKNYDVNHTLEETDRTDFSVTTAGAVAFVSAVADSVNQGSLTFTA